MATITAASRKPLRAAGASARAGAGWVDTFAVRTEPFIGKCLRLSANAAGNNPEGRPGRPEGRAGLIAESLDRSKSFRREDCWRRRQPCARQWPSWLQITSAHRRCETDT